LLTAAHPEPSRLPLQGFAGAVEQLHLQRLLGWDLNKKRSVGSTGAEPSNLIAPALSRVYSRTELMDPAANLYFEV
jgi:hypothetical protein